jgi:hypothetical protein
VGGEHSRESVAAKAGAFYAKRPDFMDGRWFLHYYLNYSRRSLLLLGSSGFSSFLLSITIFLSSPFFFILLTVSSYADCRESVAIEGRLLLVPVALLLVGMGQCQNNAV